MRKTLVSVLLLTVILLACVTALANSWGLTGALYGAVESSRAWDDYSTLSNQQGPFAVMANRYHNALFYVDGSDRLHVYTTAVYQPGSKKKDPKLAYDGQTLSIRYGSSEYYEFRAWNGEFQLAKAEIDGFRVTGVAGENGFAYQYRAEESGKSEQLVLPEKILLSGFNIDLFPRSLEEVRHRNYMQARFDSGLNCLGTPVTGGSYDADRPGRLLQPKKKGTTAVYSAPYGKSSWRAGKGKAAVGLSGDMWLLSEFRNENGESYACIRYNVSGRTQRIGYALCRDLGLPEITEQSNEPGRSFVHIDVTAAADTYLTDDPDVSQFRQFSVPKGTQFTCLGLYNNDYAYVTAEVKNGKFGHGSETVWGFVPVRDLEPTSREKLTPVMEQLAGDWVLEAGGSLAPDILHFSADGSFTAGSGEMEKGEDIVIEGAQSGTWYVTGYDPAMNLYWRETPYEMTLLFDNGRAIVRGLLTEDGGFGLLFWEGGAGYVRLEDFPASGDGNG